MIECIPMPMVPPEVDQPGAENNMETYTQLLYVEEHDVIDAADYDELERFDEPVCNYISSPNGAYQQLGFTAKPVRKILSHEFEAAKAKQNEESQQRQMAVPGGQRWGVRRHYKQALEQRLQEEEEQQQQAALQLLAKTLPELQTSEDNPLLQAWPTTAASRPASPGPVDADGDEELASLASSDTEEGMATEAPAAPTAADEALLSRGLNSNLGADMVSLHALPSELPRQRCPAEEAMREQLEQLRALQEELERQYPHGLPKSIQLRLKREGLLLPSLGYGSPQLLAEGRGTALLLR